MILVFGILFGLMVGVLISAVFGDSNKPLYRVQRDNPCYSSRYFNNPVVRELERQDKMRDVF